MNAIRNKACTQRSRQTEVYLLPLAPDQKAVALQQKPNASVAIHTYRWPL